MPSTTPNSKTTVEESMFGQNAESESCVSAIVPARNEEAVIATCVKGLAQQAEIAEIAVVNDQSTDGTAEAVRRLMAETHMLRLFETSDVPAGWTGKNNAVWRGAAEAAHRWLLFTDADAELLPGATARALQIARDSDAALVSFSPEQVTQSWYEKSLMPFVYCRLARHFSFKDVNDPQKRAAAANGQFLMIRRDAYDAIGGHAAIAGEVLEDVALARNAKGAGYRIWFGAGTGLVRTRMYRSFAAMWEGWKKNLYLLVAGSPGATYREFFSAVPWIPFLLILVGLWMPFALMAGMFLLLVRQAGYGLDLRSNQYPGSFILYYVPAVVMYGGVLFASYRAHSSGKVEWKGREVSVGASGPAR
ncbi:MAG: glycosyltransferase [Candidatus Acidiferrum sp.]|jgi:cellulose synthase/poly-beta-1,6-N-acetylglucosamine synthase-like glycosyltransferase